MSAISLYALTGLSAGQAFQVIDDASFSLSSGDFGAAVEPIGDFNGDGIPDVAVGAPGSNAIYLVFMGAEGTPTGSKEISDGVSGFDLDVSNPAANFGASIAYLGNVDGVAGPEIAVGAPDGRGRNDGVVFVLYLDTNGDVLDQFWVDHAGIGLGGVSRVGQGVAAVEFGGGGSSTRVYFGAPEGSAGGELGWLDFDSEGLFDSKNSFSFDKTGLSSSGEFGASLISLGSLGGGSDPWLAVGAPGDDGGLGRVWILMLDSGGDGLVQTRLGSAQGGFTGSIPTGARFGSSLQLVRDLDGDGIGELLVGADGWGGGPDKTGAIWLVYLNSDGTAKHDVLISESLAGFDVDLANDDLFGSAVTALGDLDEDGYPDLAVGAAGQEVVHTLFTSQSSFPGQPFVLNQSKVSNSTPAFLSQLDPEDQFAHSAEPIGDFNGDGFPDVAVGSEGDDDGDTDAGAVYFLYLDANGDVSSFDKISESSGGLGNVLNEDDEFGYAMAFIDDFDTTGRTVLAVGAHNEGDPIPQGEEQGHGAVYLLDLDANANVTSSVHIGPGDVGFSISVLDEFGTSLDRLGDFDGNGTQDLVVGARGFDSDRGRVYLLLLDPSGAVIQHYPIGDGAGGLSASLGVGDRFGHGVANMGDLDGNGTVDLAVGSPRDQHTGSETGVVFILLMQSDGTVLEEVKIGPNSFAGLAGQTWFGRSVENLGDLDGDGINDLGVGAPRLDGPAGSSEGGFWILNLQNDGTVKSYERVSTGISGFEGVLGSDDRFGASIAAIGDLDSNGSMDLFVGAKHDSTSGFQMGAGWTLRTRTTSAMTPITVTGQRKISEGMGGFTGLDYRDQFGVASTSLGDMNGDGFTDIAVGAWKTGGGGVERGAVWVLFLDGDFAVTNQVQIGDGTGGFGGILTDNNQFGLGLDCIGDLDGDGIADLAVGASGDGEGVLWILFMNADGTVKSEAMVTTPNTSTPDLSGLFNEFGMSVTGLGDLDGDGIEDVAVGARGENGSGVDRGAVWVLFLDTDGSVKSSQQIADGVGGLPGGALANFEQFGRSVSTIGDLDGDGVIDLAVGSVGTDTDEVNPAGPGGVWILFMEPDGTVASYSKITSSDLAGDPLEQDDRFGESVAGLGDIDGDGIEDIAVGVIKDDTSGFEEGAVYILSLDTNGSIRSELKITEGVGAFAGPLSAEDRFGVSVASAGDMNGDGHTDLIIGAHFDDDGCMAGETCGISNRGAVYLLELNSSLSGSPFTVWTGTTDNDWGLASNWTNNVPDGVTDAIVPPTATNPVVDSAASCNRLELLAGSALTLDDQALQVHGGAFLEASIMSSGAGAELAFMGSGSVDAVGAPSIDVPRVIVGGSAAITIGAGITQVTGDLDLLSGSLTAASGAELEILGTSTFSGGSLLAGEGTLDLVAAVFAGTSAAATPQLQVSGDLALDAGFDPSAGSVLLDGALVVTSSTSTVKFHDLIISPGPGETVTISEETDIHGRLALSSGTLDMSAAPVAVDGLILDIDGDWEGDALLNLGGGSLGAGGNVSFGGSLLTSGMVVLNSPANALVVTDATLPTVDIEAGGTVTIQSQGITINGDLNITDGDVTIEGLAVDVAGDLNMSGNAGTLTVDTELNINGSGGAGTANLSAGTLATTLPAGTPGVELDVSGDVFFSGTSATTPPKIACAGNWTSDASFTPVLDEVVFDGTTQSISDSLDVLVAFNQLTVQSSNSLTITSDLNVADRLIVAGDLIAEETATIGGDCDVSGSLTAEFGFDCRRDVDIDGGELNLGPGNGTIGGSLTGATGSLLGSGMITFDSTLTTPNPIIDTGVDDGMGNTFPMTVDFALKPGGAITVQGSPVVFGADVVLISGAVVVQTNATVDGDVVVQGGRVDIDGTTDVDGLTGVELQAGEIGGSGQLNITAGALNKTTPSLASLVGTGLTIVGDFTLSDGTLAVSGGGTTSIQGNALFTGGDIAGGSTLDVSGDVEFAGTGGTSTPIIRVAGNWISDGSYAPTTAGEVVFDGGNQEIQIAGDAPADFYDLTIDSGSSVDPTGSVLDVAHDLDLSGSLDLSGVAAADVLDVGGDLGGDGGTLNLGGGNGNIAHSLTTTGTLLASGMVILSTSTPDAIVNTDWTLPTVDINATGTVTFLGVGVGGIVGNLDHIAGHLVIATTVPISGDAMFSGGTLTGSGGGHLVVGGNVDFENTAVVLSPDIDVSGDWNADSGYDPTQGLVSLVGAATQTLTAGGQGLHFFDLDVGGVGGTTSENLTVNGDLAVFSDLGTPPVASIAGDTLVASGAVLNLGAGPHQFGGDLTVDGELNIAGPGPAAAPALLGGGNVVHTLGGSTMIAGVFTYPAGSTTFAYDVASGQTANLDTGENQELPGLILDGEGSFVLSGASVDDTTTIAGDIATAPGFSGFLTIAGATDVTGSITLSSGEWLESVRPVTVMGDVRLDGIQSSQRVQVTCKGDWHSDAAFTPDDGAVLLGDTSTVGTISGAPAFHALKIDKGTYSLEADAVANFGLEVAAPATLQIASQRLDVAGSPINGAEPGVLIDGALELGDDAVLGLDEHADVVVNGTLRMVAEWPAEARVEGYLGGDYDFSVFGSLAAKNFSFRDMSAAGIEIDGAAIIAPAPEDLRGGTFARAAGTNGPLLDLTANTTHDFRYLKFTDNSDTAGNNVTTDETDPVAQPYTLTNFAGAFSGSSFEDDPGDLWIDWLAEDRTTVTDFDASPSGGTVSLGFTTSVESTDVDVFLLERAKNSAGPWLVLAELAPVGPSTYGHVDLAAPAAQGFFYRVSERLTHGAELVHGTVAVGPRRLLAERAGTRPIGQPGAGLSQVESYTVGEGGEFATVAEFFAAAPWLARPHVDTALVRLQPGRHKAFAVPGSLGVDLILIGADAGVEVDVRTRPLTVVGVPEEHYVFLSNLDLVGSGGLAVAVENCAGAIVLDRVDLSAGGLGLPEIRALQTESLVVQASALPARVTCEDGALTLIDSVVASLEVQASGRAAAFGTSIGDAMGFVHEGAGLVAAFDAGTREWHTSASPTGSAVRLLVGDRPLASAPLDWSDVCNHGCSIQVPESRHPLFLQAAANSADKTVSLSRIAIVLPAAKRPSSPSSTSALGRQ